jgi:HPr kinase/phosphorylase
MLANLKIIRQERVTIAAIANSPILRLPMQQVNPSVQLTREVTDKNLHRPQLALAGYVGLFTYHRIQIFGNTEMHYLESLTVKKRREAFRTIAQFEIPAILLCNGHKFDPELVQIATDHGIPIFSTAYETTRAMYVMGAFLDTQFAPQTAIHGSFVDVYGMGIMFMGKSGIGKSEIALDLVERGHRLVADDVIMLTKKRDDVLIGTGTKLVEHFIEVRGLGLIDVRQMFGVRAIRFQKRLEIIVELEHWNPDAAYNRTGLDPEMVDILGVEIAYLKLPIVPGKNLTVIAEVIALNYLLRLYGYDAAQVFAQRLETEIQRRSAQRTATNTSSNEATFPHFDNDFE